MQTYTLQTLLKIHNECIISFDNIPIGSTFCFAFDYECYVMNPYDIGVFMNNFVYTKLDAQHFFHNTGGTPINISAYITQKNRMHVVEIDEYVPQLAIKH